MKLEYDYKGFKVVLDETTTRGVSGIYKITNKRNERVYIGSSCCLWTRATGHFDGLIKDRHSNTFLLNDFKKSGKENFVFEELEIVTGNTRDELKENLIIREQVYIDEYYDDQNQCYNLNQTAGLSRLGRKQTAPVDKETDGRYEKWTEEEKEERSKSFKVMWNSERFRNLRENCRKRSSDMWTKRRGDMKFVFKNIETGEVFEHVGPYKRFAKKHGLDYKAFSLLVLGKVMKSQGWCLGTETPEYKSQKGQVREPLSQEHRNKISSSLHGTGGNEASVTLINWKTLEKYEVSNRKEFARNYGLHYTTLNRVCKGECPSINDLILDNPSFYRKVQVKVLGHRKIYEDMFKAAKDFSSFPWKILEVCEGRNRETMGKKFQFFSEEEESLRLLSQLENEVENKTLKLSCVFCGLEFKEENFRSFASHLQMKHQIKTEVYTITHLHGGKRPVCAVDGCGGEVRYVNFSFKKYCKNHVSLAESEGAKLRKPKEESFVKTEKEEVKKKVNFLENYKLGEASVNTPLDEEVRKMSGEKRYPPVSSLSKEIVVEKEKIIRSSIGSEICRVSGPPISSFDYGSPSGLLKFDGKDLTASWISTLSIDEREVIAEELFKWFRKGGFPYPTHSDVDLVEEFEKLKTRDLNVSVLPGEKDGTTMEFLSNKDTTGSKLVQHFNGKEFFSAKEKKNRSMVEAFEDDAILKKVLRNRLGITYKEFFNIHGAMLRQGFRSSASCSMTSVFNCLVAKYVWEKYTPENGSGVVYDYSMGFGHRMLGAVSSKKNLKYIACDPWKQVCLNNRKMAEFLGVSDRVEIHNVGSEKYELEEDVDVVFSSPPYFDKEVYDNGHLTQAASGRSYKQFVEEWWDSVVKNVSKRLKGVLVLNMVEVLEAGKYHVLRDMTSVLEKNGFKEVERMGYTLSQSHFTKTEKKMKFEPVVVFRKV